MNAEQYLENEALCDISYHSIFEDISFVDSFLTKNIRDLKQYLLEQSTKFQWDFRNIFNPRYIYIDADIKIDLKICSDHGLGYRILVHPKSLTPLEEHESFVTFKLFFFKEERHLVLSAKNKIDNMFRDIIHRCQTEFMPPNSK